MKLESLKSSKFEAFKENILLNSIAISGGYKCSNTYRGGAALPSDSLTDDTNKTKFTDGTAGDLHDTICSTGPGTGQGGMVIPTDPFTGDYNDVWSDVGVHYDVLEFMP